VGRSSKISDFFALVRCLGGSSSPLLDWIENRSIARGAADPPKAHFNSTVWGAHAARVLVGRANQSGPIFRDHLLF
jgi:hypothetical protein